MFGRLMHVISAVSMSVAAVVIFGLAEASPAAAAAQPCASTPSSSVSYGGAAKYGENEPAQSYGPGRLCIRQGTYSAVFTGYGHLDLYHGSKRIWMATTKAGRHIVFTRYGNIDITDAQNRLVWTNKSGRGTQNLYLFEVNAVTQYPHQLTVRLYGGGTPNYGITWHTTAKG